MFDARQYFEEFNKPILESYNATILEIEQIRDQYSQADYPAPKDKWFDFMTAIAEKIIHYTKLEKELSDDYFKGHDFDELKKFNQNDYSELLGENYETSFANPAYCVKLFGD